MGVLFGTNHLAGYITAVSSGLGLYGKSGGTLWHLYGAAANYLSVVLGLWALRQAR